MAHLDLVQRAAEKEGIGRAEFIRNIVIPWAAAELGEGPPDMSIYASQDDIKLAAHRLGMTVPQYTAHAAKLQAAKDLGKGEGPPRRVSEIRAALRAG